VPSAPQSLPLPEIHGEIAERTGGEFLPRSDTRAATVSIHGLTVKGSCESVLGQPGVAVEGAGDGVQDGQSVVSG